MLTERETKVLKLLREALDFPNDRFIRRMKVEDAIRVIDPAFLEGVHFPAGENKGRLSEEQMLDALQPIDKRQFMPARARE